jgi:hypothetical protein
MGSLGGPVLLSTVCLAALGFGAATARGQSIGDLTTTVDEVTSTAGSVVDDVTSTMEGTVDDTSGQAADIVGSVSGGGTAGSGGTSGDTSGGPAGGTGSSGQSSSGGGGSGPNSRTSSIPDTCAEAARNPRDFALFITTFKEDQGNRLPASDGRTGNGIAGATAGSPPGRALISEIPPLLPGTDFWESPLALAALAVVGLGIATLLASAVRFWTGRWDP